MRSFFANTVIITTTVLGFVCLGGAAGWMLGDLPSDTGYGLTYEFVMFSIVPITLCMYGLSELNSAFLDVAINLTKIERNRLSKDLNRRIVRVVALAFFLVAVQVVFSLFMLHFPAEYHNMILGVLVGSVFGSLVYGLYVCFTVRKLGEFCERVASKNASEQRLKKYEQSFE